MDAPKKRGPKPSGLAKSSAERVAAHRARQTAKAVEERSKDPKFVIAALRLALEEERAQRKELETRLAAAQAPLDAANEANAELMDLNDDLAAKNAKLSALVKGDVVALTERNAILYERCAILEQLAESAEFAARRLRDKNHILRGMLNLGPDPDPA